MTPTLAMFCIVFSTVLHVTPELTKVKARTSNSMVHLIYRILFFTFQPTQYQTLIRIDYRHPAKPTTLQKLNTGSRFVKIIVGSHKAYALVHGRSPVDS